MAPPMTTIVNSHGEAPVFNGEMARTSLTSTHNVFVNMENVPIVISGIGGRYPDAESMNEFARNLFEKIDMITVDDRRWPTDLYDMNHRMGKLKEIDKFDGAFFGWRNRLGDSVDPQGRILLETTYEAICDSGVNPQTLRGSRTGVYVGHSSIGMPDGLPPMLDTASRTSLTEGMAWLQGTSKSMYANRVSYFFDLRGPSMVIDTACSSSMVALDVAVTDIRCGKIDQAIVAGTNINLQAFTNYFYQKLGFNAPDGYSKVWDKDADGFVRSETVASFFLQREPNAKRVYAQIIHTRTNMDGYKNTGMFFPSSEGQLELLETTYKEANIHPNDITYFEAHGTGTKAGDFQEAYAIYRAYCTSGRTKPLPVGLLKSNIGHGEAASGVASITKVILAFENQCIPANLSLNEVKANIAELKLLKPVTDNYEYTPGIAGVSSFGVGGVNGHALLRPNYNVGSDTSSPIATPALPRLVLLHGRTKEAVEHLMQFMETNPAKVTADFLTLIADVFKHKFVLHSAGFPYRGTLLIKSDGASGDFTYSRSEIEFINAQYRGRLCFFYSGIGGQSAAMAKEFMGLKLFSSKLYKLASILKPHGLDLLELLTSESSTIADSLTAKFVSTTAFQLIWTDILVNDLEVIPDVILGHSFGEISAAYAQGYVSAEEALLISFNRGLVLEAARKDIPIGLMAAVGMSAGEATERLPKNVFVACINAPKLVTLSGEKTAMKQFLEKLTGEGIFVRELDSAQFPLHTPFLEVVKDQLLSRFEAIFETTRCAKKATQASQTLKWISTCQSPEFMVELHSCQEEEQFGRRLSQYFVENLLKPVLFSSAISRLADKSIILEIAGQELFEKVIAQGSASLKYQSLFRAKGRNTETLLATLSALYRTGFNPSVERLYPAVQWPVKRGTQSISSLFKWDHRETYRVKQHPEHFFHPTASDCIIEIDPENPEFDYLYQHIIDGRSILPGTAILVFAWKRFADTKATPWTKLPVQFEEVQLKRPVFLDRNQRTTLKVRMLDPTGEFIVLERTEICATGKVKELAPDSLEHQEGLEKLDELLADMVTITQDDIYRDLHVRGYEYGDKFKGIVQYATDMKSHAVCSVRWIGHMIAFLDSLLQFTVPVNPIRELGVPVSFPLVKIDPNIFFNEVNLSNISSSEVAKNDPAVDEFLKQEDEMEVNGNEKLEEIRSKMNKVSGEADQLKNADSMIRAYLKLHSRVIVAPGVELTNFSGAFIGRRTHPQPVTVESQEFVANCEGNVLDTEKERLLRQYESVCSDECVRLLGHLELKKLSLRLAEVNDQSLDQSAKDKLANAKEGNALLKILMLAIDELTSMDTNNNFIPNPAERLAFLLAKSTLKLCNSTLNQTEIEPFLLKRYLLEYIHTDSMLALCHEERLIRPLIDLVAENFTFAKELSVLQLSPVAVYSLATKVDKYLATSTIFKLNIDYTLAHPMVGASQLESAFSTKPWDLEQLWPEDLQLKNEPHLVIIYDDPLLQEVQLNDSQFWAKLSESVLGGGFVLVLLRSKLSLLERLVCGAIFKTGMATDQELQQRMKIALREATKVGLMSVAFKSTNFGQQALLFRRRAAPETVPMCSIIIYQTDEDAWLQAVQSKLKQAAEGNDEIVWLLADGQTLPGALGFFNCLRKEPGGRQFRLLFLPDASKGSALELFNKQRNELTKLDLAVNIFKGGRLGTYRHLTRDLLNASRLTEEYHVNVGQQRNDLNNLTLVDSTGLCQVGYLPERDAPLKDRKYAVYSSALNFRDIMLASGRIFPHIVLLTKNSYLGTEFAGRDWETGQRVFGMSMGGTLASSIYQVPDHIRPIPEHWSFDDAAGIVTVYFTVWYGLIHKARLEPGSTVLIHSAAGGVGQATINICKAYNCIIFATAGSEEKRNFVGSKFQIPAEHIFSSRDSHFEGGIRRLTKGEGVRYVLNSLIGEQLDASLRLVADNGHFIELAKFEMQMNKYIGTFSFLRNLSYHGVAIEVPIFRQPHLVSQFFDWLLSNCGPNQAVQPITSQVFPIENAAAAFRFMATGRHKGKIVIRVREDDSSSGGTTISPCKPFQAQTRTHFDARKAYICVGGCGGVGLELTHWLVKKGAKRIVLTSRSKERTPYQTLSLGSLGIAGQILPYFSNDIQVYNEDITTEAGIRKLLSEVQQNCGSIGGIFHLAVSLNDSLLESMTTEQWRRTVDSKATLAVLLDKVTREVCPALDYFVCFSSVSAGRGNIGQSNYGYSNSVLERICEQRRADGLHGLAIQYGPIGDVGLMSEATKEKAAFASVRLQRIVSCLDLLNRAMQSDCAVVSSLVFADRSQQDSQSGGNMLQALWVALGVDPDTLPDHATLGELGMESMIAIEIQSMIETEYNLRLTMEEIRMITVGDLKSGNSKENLQERMMRVKKLKSHFASMNLTLPQSPTEALNLVTEGEPIFMLPSVLGVFAPMRQFAGMVNSPMIALNVTREVNTYHAEVKSAAEYYTNLLRKQYPNIKRYNLFGVDYGAFVALKMARRGFPCRVAVVDGKQSVEKINLEDGKLNDQLIEFVLAILLEGAFNDMADNLNQKERFLRAVNVEMTLEGKVKVIAQQLHRLNANKVPVEELEEMIDGALRRTLAMVQYAKKVAPRGHERLYQRLLGNLAKVQGRFLVIKDSNSAGMLAKYLQNGTVNKDLPSEEDSLINLRQVTLSLDSAVELLNEFFTSKSF